ncbi:hypothetical protein O9992_08565 [Vibrio lentus]|nr:hypothetical protein [Vibrio lentus]
MIRNIDKDQKQRNIASISAFVLASDAQTVAEFVHKSTGL